MRLQHIRHLRVASQHTPLRDALAARYVALAQAQQQQLHHLMQHRQQQPPQQQQQQQPLSQLSQQQQQQQTRAVSEGQQNKQQQQWQHQQQVGAVLQQLPVFAHAAVLLACARLRLPAARQLPAGTSEAICTVRLSVCVCVCVWGGLWWSTIQCVGVWVGEGGGGGVGGPPPPPGWGAGGGVFLTKPSH